MRRRLALLACSLAALAPTAARADETCGDLQNNGDPSTTHLVDEGCNPAAVTGVCESPASCGQAGAVAPRTGQLVFNEPPDISPRVPFGPPLSLARNYASLAADQSGYLGSLGKGWRHSFMGWLDPVTAEADEVIVRLVSGQEVLLTFDDEDPTSTYDSRRVPKMRVRALSGLARSNTVYDVRQCSIFLFAISESRPHCRNGN